MQPSAVLETLLLDKWRGPFTSEVMAHAVAALEQGKVLYLPQLPFRIEEDEDDLLDPVTAGAARKNISYDPASGHLANATVDAVGAVRLKGMMDRFGRCAARFLEDLIPAYASALEKGRTSFRPLEIAGRTSSPRHDDKRLHVDAFPSRPLRGKRILRLFSNVARDGAARQWRVGEPFGAFARQFMPRVGAPPSPWRALLLDVLGITKGRRSAYDHYMLNLHDGAKLDADYQAGAPRAEIAFPAGATWLCYTDQVLHAALSGHGALEQTFYLPVAAMAEPGTSPLRVLEGIKGRALV